MKSHKTTIIANKGYSKRTIQTIELQKTYVIPLMMIEKK